MWNILRQGCSSLECSNTSTSFMLKGRTQKVRTVPLFDQTDVAFFLENSALHLPVLDDEMITFIDILTLCNYCILSNVLDPRTYNFPDIQYGEKANATHLSQREKHDYNALSPDHRHYFSYVRGLSINLIHWLHCHFIFKGKERAYDVTSIARQYLHNQVLAILKYKITAEKKRIGGVPNCTAKALCRQISLLFSAEQMTELGTPNVDDLTHMDSLAWEMTLIPSQCSKAVEFNGIVVASTISEPIILIMVIWNVILWP